MVFSMAPETGAVLGSRRVVVRAEVVAAGVGVAEVEADLVLVRSSS